MSLDELSQFYRNFAELDQAGINYLSSFETLRSTERQADRKHQYQIVIHFLKKGRPLAEAFKATPLVPVFDVPLIKAAEDSGHLVDTFKKLSLKYAVTSAAAKSIRGQLTKPFFTFCGALFILPFPDLFTGKTTVLAYLRNSFGPLTIILVAAFLLHRLWILSFYNLEAAQRWQKIFSYTPFFRSLGHRIALENFSSALALMLDSGIDLFASLRQSAQCSANPDISKAIDRIASKIKAGGEIGSAFQIEGQFSSPHKDIIPHELTTAIKLGHQSGKLPEFLQRYSQGLKNEIDQSVQAFTKVFPTVVYIFVVFYVGFSIVSAYKGQMTGLQQLVE